MLKRATPAVTPLLLLVLINLSGFSAASGFVATRTTGRSIATPVPSVVVAINLQNPDFTVREMKYRVFYNKGEVKRIPMTDYDFKAAFTDELLSALTQDKRMEWRIQSKDEAIDVTAIMKKKGSPPKIGADRILLVEIVEYGAFLADLAADKFYISATFRLVEQATGRKLWEKRLYERIDLQGKVAELQADNQKGLKEGVNKVLEKVCAKIGEEMRQAKI